MKTIIAGSRSASYADVVHAVSTCPWHGEITEVVSGCARGADTHGESWAKHQGMPVERMPADWDQHGKAAGPIRNRAMAGYADALIAVWDGRSPGTKNMIEEARKHGLRVFVHRTDKGVDQ